MKENGLDKKLRNLFDDEVPMDLDMAWNRLEERRAKGKGRPIFLPILLVGLLLAGLVVGYYMYDTKPITPAEPPVEIAKTEGINSATQEMSERQNSSIEKAITKSAIEKTTIEEAVVSTTQNLDKITINNSKTIFVHKEKERQEVVSIEKLPPNISTTSLAVQEKEAIVILDRTETKSIGLMASLPLELLAIPSLDVEFAENYAINTISKQNKYNDVSLGLSFSFGKPFRDLKASDNAEATFIDYRNSTESVATAKGIQLSLTKDLSKHFFVKTGIAFENITTQAKRNTTVTYDTIIPNQVVEVYNGQKTYGDQSAVATDITKYTLWQNYNSISIPLLLGIRTPVKSNAYVSLALGIQSGISQVSGNIFIPNEEAVEMAELSTYPYKREGLLKGVPQLELAYIWDDNWQFTAGLTYQKDLNSRTKDAAGFTEKYQVLAAEIGVRYKL